MTTKIAEQWAPYSELLSISELEALLKDPQEACQEEARHVVPSIVRGSDGPHVQGVIMITKSYLAEVRVLPNVQDFDFIDNRIFTNYRIHFEETLVKLADNTQKTYETANVSFWHGQVSVEFSTTVLYVGNDRDSWVANLYAVLPVSLVLVD